MLTYRHNTMEGKMNTTIHTDDLWSAIRGLGMGRMSEEKLRELIKRHSKIDAYASQVITEAARQTLKVRKEVMQESI